METVVGIGCGIGSGGPRRVVELREQETSGGEGGFEFGVLGDHDADVPMLVSAVRARAEAEMSRCYLEPDPGGFGWTLAGENVAGRLEWDPMVVRIG